MGINPIRPNDYWVLTKNPLNPNTIYQIQPSTFHKKIKNKKKNQPLDISVFSQGFSSHFLSLQSRFSRRPSNLFSFFLFTICTVWSLRNQKWSNHCLVDQSCFRAWFHNLQYLTWIRSAWTAMIALATKPPQQRSIEISPMKPPFSARKRSSKNYTPTRASRVGLDS